MLVVAMILASGICRAQPTPPAGPARAVAELQAAIRANPGLERNYTDLGNLLLSLQSFNEAASVLEQARQRFPQSAQAALSLGVSYYSLRRFSGAIGLFLETARLAPEIEQPIQFLSRMLEHAGERESEIVAVFRAYARNHNGSALGHFALGKATASEGELRRAITLAPSMAEAHFELGNVLEGAAKLAESAREFERAASLSPADPVPHYRLYRLYTRLGQTSRAAAQREMHEKLTANEKAEADRRQAGMAPRP